MSEEIKLSAQILDLDYMDYPNNVNITDEFPDKNIQDLSIEVIDNKLYIRWKDAIDTHWQSNTVVKTENYIPSSPFYETPLFTTTTKNQFSVYPFEDDNILPNTLYCYRVYTSFSNSPDLYSGFKNIFFVYVFDGVNDIGDSVIKATSILTDDDHMFVTKKQISDWNTGNNLTNYYTKPDVDNKIADLVNSAPETLNTLKELADALGDDPNFATTITTSIGNKVTAIQGKSLSTNDFTDADKTKLDGLTNYVHPLTHPVSMITGLANIATSGSYNDLIDKPNFATIATSGNYNDLINKPTIPDLSKLSTVATSGSYTDLLNIPTLSTVATSGNYEDLINKPNIPKLPTLSTVAVSGSYNDLSDKPTIPDLSKLSTVSVSGSYNDLTDKPVIPVIPKLATVATTGDYNDLVNKPITPTLATVATSGNYNDLINKPIIPTLPTLSKVATSGDYNDLVHVPVLSAVANSGNYSDLNNKPLFANVAISGSYNDLTDKPNIPVFATVAVTGRYNDLTNKPLLSTVAISGDYNDLTNKPSTSIDSLATVAKTGNYNDLLEIPVYAAVAASGSYTDLVNKPYIDRGTAIRTVVLGDSSNSSSANYAISEGYSTTANGIYSHTSGNTTSAGGYTAAFICGQYGDAPAANSFSLANGTSSTNKGLAVKMLQNGQVFADGAYASTGADYAEMFEWLDGNPDSEDRVGYFVTLNGDKIIKATSLDQYVLGIVSSSPSIIGDANDLRWENKYVTDDWGRIQYSDVTIPAKTETNTIPPIYDNTGHMVEPEQNIVTIIVPEHIEKQPIINPLWDPTKTYNSRLDRKEWSAIGMMGKLLVRDDGTCVVNGFCKPNDNGIATACNIDSFIKYRVIKRINDNIVEVIIK